MICEKEWLILKKEFERLRGKRVLLFVRSGYANGIYAQMKELGIDVDYYNDKPDDGVITKTLGRLKTPLYQKIIERYYQEILKKKKERNYDYILVIRGEYTPVKTIQELKSTFPKAKLILYMWDSTTNNKGIDKKWKYFDRVVTFDRKDYLENADKIEFLPLFYYEAYLPKLSKEELKYDIAFIGTGHGDRYKISKQVEKICQENNMKFYSYMYLPHKLLYFFNKFTNPEFKGAKLSDFHYEQLPFKTVYKIYSQSKCVIDIESITQTGLTMRTIEMIGLHKKLISTNPDIKNYDFYNESNNRFVDRNNFVIDKEFVDKKYEELDEEIYEKYSLSNWISEILQ